VGGKKKQASSGREPRFTRDMLVSDAVDADPRVGDILLRLGLPCRSCIVAWHETLEEGCAPLGLEVNRVLAELNALGEE